MFFFFLKMYFFSLLLPCGFPHNFYSGEGSINAEECWRIPIDPDSKVFDPQRRQLVKRKRDKLASENDGRKKWRSDEILSHPSGSSFPSPPLPLCSPPPPLPALKGNGEGGGGRRRRERKKTGCETSEKILNNPTSCQRSKKDQYVRDAGKGRVQVEDEE